MQSTARSDLDSGTPEGGCNNYQESITQVAKSETLLDISAENSVSETAENHAKKNV